MNLWRFNPITGFWRIERTCAPETADQWLALFQTDEPNAHFKLSRFSPRNNPTKD